ncbi:MAG TPA: hypothetical protein VK609_07270 [Mucilaginibacter sp.]|nr:hypothetical protein [Mucilaginibacter sp.]
MAALLNLKSGKYVNWALFCLGCIAVTYGYLKREKALKNTIVVIAKITGFQYAKIDRSEVDVQYFYNGKMINNQFSLHHTDSLKVNTKVRLCISRIYPTESEYIKYIGVQNQ